jgi:hypothetical protein
VAQRAALPGKAFGPRAGEVVKIGSPSEGPDAHLLAPLVVRAQHLLGRDFRLRHLRQQAADGQRDARRHAERRTKPPCSPHRTSLS